MVVPHFPRSLHAPPLGAAVFALAAAGLAVMAALDSDALTTLETVTVQPYWWFLENVVAWASGGFTR